MSIALYSNALSDIGSSAHILLGNNNYVIDLFTIQPIKIATNIGGGDATIVLSSNSGVTIFAVVDIANPTTGAASVLLFNQVYSFPVPGLVCPRGTNISVNTNFGATVTQLVYSIQLYGSIVP